MSADVPGDPSVPRLRPAGAAARAESFLQVAGEFRLGDLVTESAHPRSIGLHRTARTSIVDALGTLFDVDGDVVSRYDAWSCSGQPERMAAALAGTFARGGRVFFTGCGATGRLSIQLDSTWRAFWQRRRAEGRTRPDPDAWEHRTRSVMAGGDYALVKSVEGFEDYAPFGRKQIADMGLATADTVFAVTEGGETSFVIGTAWQAVENGARVFFVYNNPDDLLRAHVRRSREVLDEPRIEKVNLTTGPMAITGSTRMQATSIQLAVMLTVLEMVLRGVLASHDALDARFETAADVPAQMRAALAALHRELSGVQSRKALASLVAIEEGIYRAGGRTTYLADSLGVDVLTDTTERSPTFCTPPFRKWDDPLASESWAFLVTPEPVTEAAWVRLLRRPPQTIEWSSADLLRLLDEATAARQLEVLQEIGRRELMRFRIGLDGLSARPVRDGDAVTAVLAEADGPLIATGAGRFARLLREARDAGAKTAVIAVGRADWLSRSDALADTGAATVTLPVPGPGFLLDPIARIGTKMLLNALSTCTMVRLGRVLGNRMIWVVPSNLKLIDRATRYVRDLAGVPYSVACHALFEAIEHVEPRRRAGQGYPAPVGVATMRLLHRLDLPEAERRLEEELAAQLDAERDRLSAT